MAIDAMGGVRAKKDKIPALMINDDYVGQRKIDGFRLTVEINPGGIKLWGRGTGKNDGERTDYTDLLPHIINALSGVPHGTVLDGEIAYIDPDTGYEDYNKTSNVMGSSPSRAMELQMERGWLVFIMFDCPVVSGSIITSRALRDRYQQLLDIADTYIDSKYVQVLPVVYTTEAKNELLDIELSNGREGIMLKNWFSPYIPGKKRENTWYKVKAEHDADVIILGYNEPDEFTQVMRGGRKLVENGQPVMARNRYFNNNWIGSLIIGQYVPERILSKEQRKWMDANQTYAIEREDGMWVLVPVGNVSSGLSDALRAEISADKDGFFLQQIMITYFKQTDDSYTLARFKRFRNDKPREECLWEE